MMHAGWEAERGLWEDATRAARSVLDIGNALAHLEDWIALDYAPGSDVCLRLAVDVYSISEAQCSWVLFMVCTPARDHQKVIGCIQLAWSICVLNPLCAAIRSALLDIKCQICLSASMLQDHLYTVHPCMQTVMSSSTCAQDVHIMEHDMFSCRADAGH